MMKTREHLQIELNTLNIEIQNLIANFIEQNKLTGNDIIAEIDDGYTYGMFFTPTENRQLQQQNKGGYRDLKFVFAPGKIYNSNAYGQQAEG